MIDGRTQQPAEPYVAKVPPVRRGVGTGLMMRKENAHLVANAGLTVVGWAVLLLVTWRWMDVSIVAKIGISIAWLLLAAFIGHRFIPRVTGPVVERLFKEREGPSGGDYG